MEGLASYPLIMIRSLMLSISLTSLFLHCLRWPPSSPSQSCMDLCALFQAVGLLASRRNPSQGIISTPTSLLIRPTSLQVQYRLFDQDPMAIRLGQWMRTIPPSVPKMLTSETFLLS